MRSNTSVMDTWPVSDIFFSMMLQPEKSGAGCNYCKVNRFSIGCIRDQNGSLFSGCRIATAAYGRKFIF